MVFSKDRMADFGEGLNDAESQASGYSMATSTFRDEDEVLQDSSQLQVEGWDGGGDHHGWDMATLEAAMPDFLKANRKRQAIAAATAVAVVVLAIVGVATGGFGLASSPSPPPPHPPPPPSPSPPPAQHPSPPPSKLTNHGGSAAISAKACMPGHFFRCEGTCSEGKAPGQCERCPAGKADLDVSSRTPCHACEVGKYAPGGGIQCMDCEGQFDHDSDPATPCAAHKTCTQQCAPLSDRLHASISLTSHCSER
jgi:hypothetical protein